MNLEAISSFKVNVSITWYHFIFWSIIWDYGKLSLLSSSSIFFTNKFNCRSILWCLDSISSCCKIVNIDSLIIIILDIIRISTCTSIGYSYQNLPSVWNECIETRSWRNFKRFKFGNRVFCPTLHQFICYTISMDNLYHSCTIKSCWTIKFSARQTCLRVKIVFFHYCLCCS